MRKWRIQCYLPRAQSLNWNGHECAIGDTNLSVVDNPIRCKSNMPSESTICRKCYKSAESWRRIEMIVLNANVGLVRIPMDVPMQAFHKSSKWQSEADDDAVDSDKFLPQINRRVNLLLREISGDWNCQPLLSSVWFVKKRMAHKEMMRQRHL